MWMKSLTPNLSDMDALGLWVRVGRHPKEFLTSWESTPLTKWTYKLLGYCCQAKEETTLIYIHSASVEPKMTWVLHRR